MTRKCPNCGKAYAWTSDPEYANRVVHQTKTCPYRFDFAHDDREFIKKLIRDLFKERKLNV